MTYPEDLSNVPCAGLDINTFFDTYEESATGDGNFARMIDRNYCLACPALQACLAQGIKTKSHGVWGGVYLEEGKVSKKFNAHKTASDWQQIAEAIDG